MRAAITFEPAEFVSPDGEDLPTGLRARTKFYTVPVNGVKVRVMLTTAAKDEPRGTIILYPGRTEFIEKYLETAEDFIARGFTVLIMDPRGQGLSARLLPDRLRSYVDDFQDYADDLAGVVESFKPHLPKPHILVGHSMGGCVALQAVISGVIRPSAVICSAPMLGLFDMSTPILIGMIRLLSFFGMAKNTLPFQRGQAGIPVPFAANKLTSDPERYAHWARYFNTSEALRLGPPTYGWIVQALRAMNFVNKNADKLKVATLIVAAGADPIVEPSSNREFAAAAGADFAVVPGALHELFLERDELRDQFFQKVDSFLEDNAF
jgi:lysophospholipase